MGDEPILSNIQPVTINTMLNNNWMNNGLIFTARKRSLGQGNIFIGVCQEFCSQGGEYLSRCPLREQAPPFPGPGSPPGTRYTSPWSRHPPEQTPRDQVHPFLAQSMLGDTVNARAVRILLECNLVQRKKIGLNFVTCERSLSGIIVTFSALITTNKMVTVSNSILPSTQSEMSLQTGSTVLCVLYNYELLWCIHTGQNQDRNRDQEQMGCMKLCVNFHITPEPGETETYCQPLFWSRSLFCTVWLHHYP